MSATVSGPTSHADEPSAAELLAADDIVGLMRACHDRRLEREGIPMVLGFVDERREIPVNSDAAQLAEGTAFADVFDRYSAALVPWARDDDEGAVITAMQVLAYTHFAPEARPITDAAASVAEGV
ncbi:hypothetical protein [Microbacterium hominis]|uniref:Uncharacterized protein n=1 Tax=Microbacterium hominis TaxID=162426 RepID=A0A7D4Q0M4_9MICO|nr:hypothetical protein [Microbacterium hominis]QKJ18271.1 hypothetical protein HQM25_01885 [Microbacterium hominis]